MPLIIPTSQIASDPLMATLMVANIGAASAAVAGAARIVLLRSPRRCLVPWACMMVALVYIGLTLDWFTSADRLSMSGLMEFKWLAFELLVMGLINLVLIEFCSFRRGGCPAKAGGRHDGCR